MLDPRSRAEAQARVAAARAALESARQDAEAAKAKADFFAAELERVEPLSAKGVVSREALDRARMDVIAANANLRSAQHSVDVARYELEAAQTALEYSAASHRGEPAERVLVRSPIDGRVLKVQRDCEGPVRTGDVLLELGDPSRLEVEVDLLSADAVKVRSGGRVLFDRWGGDQPLEGLVRTVEPAGFTKISALGVEETGAGDSRFHVAARALQRLGDGYRVEARFVLWQEDNVLQVPAQPVRRGGGWAVFSVNDGRAALREVQVGPTHGADRTDPGRPHRGRDRHQSPQRRGR